MTAVGVPLSQNNFTQPVSWRMFNQFGTIRDAGYVLCRRALSERRQILPAAFIAAPEGCTVVSVTAA
jgi:hypothetical protein